LTRCLLYRLAFSGVATIRKCLLGGSGFDLGGGGRENQEIIENVDG